jgi:N-ethylmaleimide reductase
MDSSSVDELSEHKLAYVALLDGFGFGVYDHARPLTVFDAKPAFKGLVLANNSYMRDVAEGAIHSVAADFVSFGRPFISKPDLAERFEKDQPLIQVEHDTF